MEFKIVYSMFLRSGGEGESFKTDLWEHKTLKNKSKGKDRKEGKIREAVVVCCVAGGGGCERGRRM